MSVFYFLLALSSLQSLSQGQNLVCQEVWRPADEEPVIDEECQYDGSLIPDCDYFLNNYTSYYHSHEYGL